MKYQEMAAEIVKLIGGKENIQSITHCVTRVRFVVKDSAKADLEAIKNVEGVITCQISSGQHQVVVGPIVKDVYAAVMAEVGELEEAKVDADDRSEKQPFSISNLAKQGLDTLVSCFVPAIPLIAGSGMIKVLVVLLSYAGLLDSASTTYTILNTIGDGVFYFLPIAVAINAAKKMEVDVFLSVALAMILLHPDFMELASVEGGVTFLGINVSVLDYSTQALPVIFGVWLLKYVDKFADKVSPNIVKVFLRPMIDLLIVAPIVMFIIGPISGVISGWLYTACTVMQTWGWLAVGINALIFPLMVLTGTHNATIPLIVQMFATQGFDAIFLPSGLAANIAEAGAACAVALKTKNKKLRATGLSATASALLGITEPALYGVNLRMKRPFIAMMLGAGIGGCFIGLMGLSAPTFVTPSILTVAIFGATAKSFLLTLATVPFTFAVTFILTWFIGFKDLEENT